MKYGRVPSCKIISINMAALSTFFALLLSLVLLLFLMPQVKTATVEVTVPVQPVTVGGILAIECKIWNMERDHTVKMFRATKTHTEQLTTGLFYVGSSLGQRIYLSKKIMPKGVTVFFATIVDVSMLDQGEYVCKLYTLSGTDHVKLTEGSVDVAVYYLPNSIYPQCQSAPSSVVNLNENVPLELTCISAKGNPAVELRWIDNLNQELSSQNIIQDDTVSAGITLRTSTRHGSLFICEMTSPGFKDFKRTCQIGPVTIKTNKKPENTAVVQQNIHVVPSETENKKTLIANECRAECSSKDKYTILYLSMATVGAALLTIVFLITTIIMCFKYHNVSNEVQNTQRNITSCDAVEPVYVSLQRRPEPAIPERRSIYKEPDRSSLYSAPERRSLYKEPEVYKEPDTNATTYMSVEDPNNPGSKVLMPKEVFEEFYNSLTVKKV